MKSANIALVGIGAFGKNHFRVLKELEREGFCRLVKVVDLNQELLYKAKEKYPNIEVDTSIESLIKEDVDVVDVVTPASTHYKLAKYFLAHGKHIFVEKPFTLSYSHAEELVSIAGKRGLHIGVGHIFRYNEALRRVKKMVVDGELGELLYLYGRFLNFKNPRPDVGVVFNFSVHFLDIFDFLLDKMPRKLMSVISYLLGRKAFEDYAFTILSYSPNIAGYIESSWLYPDKLRELLVAGEDGVIHADLLFQKYYFSPINISKEEGRIFVSKEESVMHEVSFKEPLKLELSDYIQSIIEDRVSISNGDVGKRIVYLAEKALESGRESRGVSINYEEA